MENQQDRDSQNTWAIGRDIPNDALYQYQTLVRDLSFQQVWERQDELIDLLLKYIDTYWEQLWEAYKAEYGRHATRLPEEHLMPHCIAYQIQHHFSRFLMPVVFYAMSQSRDYSLRWKGDKHGCTSMAFFADHTCLDNDMSADLLITHQLVALISRFNINIVLYANKYAMHEYRILVNAHAFAPREALESGRYMERWQFFYKRFGFSVLRSIFKVELQDLHNCCLYLQALDQRSKYPWLAYKLGSKCAVKGIHESRDGVILAVDDPRWSVMFPCDSRGCDCTFSQLSDSEAEAYPGKKRFEDMRPGFMESLEPNRQFDPDTLTPYPAVVYY